MPPYPTPNATFNYVYRATKNTDGTFRRVGQYSDAVVYDNIDNAGGDGSAQIGEITNDTYHVYSTQTSPPLLGIGTYYAKLNSGNGFIGKYSGNYYIYSTTTVAANNIAATVGQAFTLCFVSGTCIRIASGDIAVEDLKVGDQVVTASGAHRPVRWLGHRTIDWKADTMPSQAWPVRILASAFGESLPKRDLYVSPGHPILVGADADGAGGHLVPAMCLINGTTIDRVKVDSVTYWHVELDAHDILLAEGLPAESYLDWGDRAFFSEAEQHALMNPDFVVPGLGARCRPVAIDGPVVEAERRRLDAAFASRLAAACAWPESISLGV